MSNTIGDFFKTSGTFNTNLKNKYPHILDFDYKVDTEEKFNELTRPYTGFKFILTYLSNTKKVRDFYKNLLRFNLKLETETVTDSLKKHYYYEEGVSFLFSPNFKEYQEGVLLNGQYVNISKGLSFWIEPRYSHLFFEQELDLLNIPYTKTTMEVEPNLWSLPYELGGDQSYGVLAVYTFFDPTNTEIKVYDYTREQNNLNPEQDEKPSLNFTTEGAYFKNFYISDFTFLLNFFDLIRLTTVDESEDTFYPAFSRFNPFGTLSSNKSMSQYYKNGTGNLNHIMLKVYPVYKAFVSYNDWNNLFIGGETREERPYNKSFDEFLWYIEHTNGREMTEDEALSTMKNRLEEAGYATSAITSKKFYNSFYTTAPGGIKLEFY